MKNKKYTQKKIIKLGRRRGIFINNNKLKIKNILKGNNIFLLTIAIIANKNKKLTQEQINTIKQDLNNPNFYKLGGKLTKYFDISIKMKPNKVITNKGILVRMGKGKGKIKTKAIFLLKNMVCIELKQKDINNKKILYLLNSQTKKKGEKNIKFLFSKFLKKYTFFTIKSNINI